MVECLMDLIGIRDAERLELVSERQSLACFRVQVKPLLLVPDVAQRCALSGSRVPNDQDKLIVRLIDIMGHANLLLKLGLPVLNQEKNWQGLKSGSVETLGY